MDVGLWQVHLEQLEEHQHPDQFQSGVLTVHLHTLERVEAVVGDGWPREEGSGEEDVVQIVQVRWRVTGKAVSRLEARGVGPALLAFIVVSL